MELYSTIRVFKQYGWTSRAIHMLELYVLCGHAVLIGVFALLSTTTPWRGQRRIAP